MQYLIQLQKHIFLLTLLAASILGLSLAYFSTQLLSASLSIAPSIKQWSKAELQAKKNAKHSQKPSTEDIQNLVIGNLIRDSLIDQTRLRDAEFSETVSQSYFDISQFNLIGVLSGSPKYSRAIIQKDRKDIDVYSLGDYIDDARILRIKQNEVVFETLDEERHSLFLDTDESQDAKKGNKQHVASGSRKTKPVSGAQNEVQNISLNRDRFQQLIQNQAELFRLGFAPSIKNGKIDGWRLLKVPRDHFLYSMGARTGDIIRRYNGQELKDQSRMIHMWQSLQTANHVSVDIERQNKWITYEISIQ